MRSTGIGFALVMGLVLGACGGKASDEDQVRDVTKKYAQSFIDEDFDDACDLLTSEAKEQLLTAGAVLGGGDCPGILGRVWDTLDPADKKRLRDGELKVTTVKITGRTAEARINFDLDGDNDPTRLRKKGDTWLVDFEPDSDE